MEDGSRRKQTILKKIPPQVIDRAKGLAIFSIMREGLWISGSGGSGVLLARRADGTWSAPSAIMLHTTSLEFLIGVDIYDCVLVINNEEALNALAHHRSTVGDEITAASGPRCQEHGLEYEPREMQDDVWTYVKGRSFYTDVHMHGTVIMARNDENERFYGERLGSMDIFNGRPRRSSREVKMLTETVKASQGDSTVDERSLPKEPAPGDIELARPDHVFGIPDTDDRDPYGVFALESQGVEIREAGTKSRASSDHFDYRPSPSSPLYSTFQHRRSNSTLSAKAKESQPRGSIDRSTQTTDMSTQTCTDVLQSVDEVARDQPSHAVRVNGRPAKPTQNGHQSDTADIFFHPEALHIRDYFGLTDGIVEEPEEIQARATPQFHVVTKAKLVTIPAPKRASPPIPPRNPARSRFGSAEGVTAAVQTGGDLPAEVARPAFEAVAGEKGWSEAAPLRGAGELGVVAEGGAGPRRAIDESLGLGIILGDDNTATSDEVWGTDRGPLEAAELMHMSVPSGPPYGMYGDGGKNMFYLRQGF